MLPGLFNCHVHMCSDAGTGVREKSSDASLTVRALKNLKTLINSGVTYIRDADAPQLTESELRAAIEEAHKCGAKTFTHAQGMEGIKNALRAGVDSIEHGFFMDDWCFDWMKEHNVFFVPTLAAPYWIKYYGTDAGTPFNKYDKTGFEAVLMVENGMTPMEAIKCGTINAAELLSVQDTHGSITVGKKANFSIFEKSPLDDIHAMMDCAMTVLNGDVVFEK